MEVFKYEGRRCELTRPKATRDPGGGIGDEARASAVAFSSASFSRRAFRRDWEAAVEDAEEEPEATEGPSSGTVAKPFALDEAQGEMCREADA
jgi:hypothetical protein